MDGSGSGLAHDRGLELVVVALPAEDDEVRRYSSEKEPHLTLLYLGETKIAPTELANITAYIEHAASQLTRFWLDVERRGELGDKKADVLFFNKKWMKNLVNFRGNLLQNELINRAYLSVDQFPDWIPHLTMGFPETPAKKDTREYQRFSSVRFDRIALWTGDSTGPTFQLKSDDYDMEVAMSQSQQGADIAADILEHYGVKGMKWGKRKGVSVPPGKVLVDRNKKGALTTAGGVGYRPHADAAEKVVTQQIAKKSGVQALSNKELQVAITRMNLEQQFVRLSPQSKKQKAQKFVKETLLGIGKQQVNQVANNAASQSVAAALAKTTKK